MYILTLVLHNFTVQSIELVKNKFEKLYDPADCGWKDKPVIIPPWPSYLSVAFKPALLLFIHEY